jgi:hypothetical protein
MYGFGTVPDLPLPRFQRRKSAFASVKQTASPVPLHRHELPKPRHPTNDPRNHTQTKQKISWVPFPLTCVQPEGPIGDPRLPRNLALAPAALFALSFATASAQYHFHTPKQVPGVSPCPNLKGFRKLVENGHPAIEVLIKMNVDVDGAPTAYGPPGKKALDIDAHARAPKESPHPGSIVGYMTESVGGPPTIQGPQDPAPGYFVSQTDFADKNNKRMEDPRRYVDAARINYVVQGRIAKQTGVQLGDFVTAYSCRTGKSAFAIVGDSGNESGAEGSLALVRALGYDIRDGIKDSVDDREIVLHYYPKSNPQKQFFKTQAELDQAAEKLGLKK